MTNRLTRLLLVACLAALSGACGSESPEASPSTPDSTSPTRSVAPSPTKPEKSADPSPAKPKKPRRSVPRPPMLDDDLRNVVVRHTPDQVIFEVKAADPGGFPRDFVYVHGLVAVNPEARPGGDAGPLWQWEVAFDKGSRQPRMLGVLDWAYEELEGCFIGSRLGPELSAAINYQDGIIKAVFPRRCFGPYGELTPAWIRASAEYTPKNDRWHGPRELVFTDQLVPGEQDILHR
jgi:hypothetical protein